MKVKDYGEPWLCSSVCIVPCPSRLLDGVRKVVEDIDRPKHACIPDLPKTSPTPLESTERVFRGGTAYFDFIWLINRVQ